MDNTRELYHITTSPEYGTVMDLLNDPNSVASSYLNDPDRFLSIVGEDGLTNRERIELTYIHPGELLNKGKKADKLPLKTGTLLYVEFEYINQESFLTEGIEVVSTSDVAFKAKQLAAIEGDPGYFLINKPIEGKVFQGTSKESYPEVTVWIWCRSLSPKSDEATELTGQFFDLSPFIQKCTTNMVGKNGGNWNIVLPPLICELNDDRKWVIKKGTLDKYINDKGTSIQGEGFVSQGSLFDAKLSSKNNELVRSQFLFHNMINPNDLIFIRFDTLDMEREQRYNDGQDYNVSKDNIAGRIYDMIGLVDSNTITTNPQTTDVSINIQGRDLSKLFLDDGVSFYPLELSQGLLKFAGQSQQKNILLNRIFGDGALQFLFLAMHSSIDKILKFIIQQLANIEIIPDSLFSSWGNRINYRFNVAQDKSKSNQEFKPQATLEPAAGIWKIVKLVIDESVAKRRIQDSSFSTAQGSLLNFIHTAVQQPLTEAYFDTYGDQYHLIVRKPPYDQKALISLIEGKVNTEDGTVETPPAIINIEQDDVLQETLAMDDSQVYSWYHFFPKGIFFGDSNSYSLGYLGALYFEEYAKLWGAKSFQQSHPYMPFIRYNNNEKGLFLYEEQAIEDLKYVVESSQYLPFTRKGTLVLNGDRRIKIGNIIRYKSTGEIFFVEGVQQDYQITENGIERTTNVNVTRGMIEQLIYGAFYTTESGATRYVSYFNIINTDLVKEYNGVVEKVTKKRRARTKTKNPETSIQLPDVFTGMVRVDDIVLEKGNTGIGYLEKYNKYPENKRLFVRFINEINKLGYNVIITSTNRTHQEQWALKYGKNGNLNNAEPGNSHHEQFAAIDINITNRTTGITHKKRTSKDGWIATGVPALAKSLGLQWAGGDGSFGSYVDRVHFQIAGQPRLIENHDTIEEYTEDIKSREINRNKIFSNFKVNKFSFNFFLKKLQFDPSYRNVTSRNLFSNDEQGTPIAPIIISRKRN